MRAAADEKCGSRKEPMQGEDAPAERLSAATAFGTTGGGGMKKQILTMKFIFNKEGKTYSAPSYFSSGIGRIIAL